MKNLIYQYYLPYNKGEKTPQWVEIGVQSAKQYSDAINTEYMFYDKPYLNSSIAVFESLRLIFDPLFDQYDNILLLDVDMIINTTDNIFDIPFEDIAMVHEHGAVGRPPVPGASFDKQFWDNYFNNPFSGVVSYAHRFLDPNFKWKAHSKDKFVLYNGGLQMWSKDARLKARKLFRKTGHDHFRSITNKGETPYLNMMFIHHDFKITELDNSWNKLNFQWQRDGDLGRITHYNDVAKQGMLTHGK